ncbi:MAG: hypothetical protein QXS54_00870 [Candidatus Methanomethylicaceae archaeon]
MTIIVDHLNCVEGDTDQVIVGGYLEGTSPHGGRGLARLQVHNLYPICGYLGKEPLYIGIASNGAFLDVVDSALELWHYRIEPSLVRPVWLPCSFKLSLPSLPCHVDGCGEHLFVCNTDSPNQLMLWSSGRQQAITVKSEAPIGTVIPMRLRGGILAPNTLLLPTRVNGNIQLLRLNIEHEWVNTDIIWEGERVGAIAADEGAIVLADHRRILTHHGTSWVTVSYVSERITALASYKGCLLVAAQNTINHRATLYEVNGASLTALAFFYGQQTPIIRSMLVTEEREVYLVGCFTNTEVIGRVNLKLNFPSFVVFELL